MILRLAVDVAGGRVQVIISKDRDLQAWQSPSQLSRSVDARAMVPQAGQCNIMYM